jgi:hypothetical protein
MPMELNLLGELQEYCPERDYKPKGREKYKTMQEIHGYTEGQVCGTCVHCRSIEYANKYYKCDAWILSHSSATDIRVRGKACGIWQGVNR